FLTTVLNNPEFDNDWSGDIVDGLTPRKEQYSRDRLERIVKLFSQEQIAVVIEFLKIYPQLQPYSAHALLDERRSELEEAIRFWQSQLL
ncbi:MAG: hypothetical protein JNM70_25390, partial [Anaerolineae bacterium]|nr:hypothetical protein [Anaerolineae bacterium]